MRRLLTFLLWHATPQPKPVPGTVLANLTIHYGRDFRVKEDNAA